MQNDNDTPAWMVCDELISKMRDEILSQAVSAMREQLEKKHIALEGQLPSASEEGSEKERDAFLLEQIVKQHENMERQFGEYLEVAGLDKTAMARAEGLRRFLLELRQIVLLDGYAKECERWLADAEKELKGRDAAEIMAKTIKKDEKRREVLDYALKNKQFVRENVFSEGEKHIMEDALRLTSE